MVERERSEVGVDPVEFHPNEAAVYRWKISNLKRGLAEGGEASRACGRYQAGGDLAPNAWAAVKRSCVKSGDHHWVARSYRS
ncbi:hypothetical protein [Bradyrhizobium macuxiense]|uniref:hypothetical protein n=1 Tax=Bradyrhizobium macuxiense TaxID=1755647 RepID=UPI000AB00C6D|nr:hypothetical protein [Bradyrhizobium macuxiense]